MKFKAGRINVLKLIEQISGYELVSFSSLVHMAQQIHDSEQIKDEIEREKGLTHE